MRPEGIELDRTQIRHVADACDALIARHGSAKAAARAIGSRGDVFSRFARRSAYERATREALTPIAGACGVTVDELLAGKGPRPGRAA